MPELPEVEVVRRGLESGVVGSRITGVDVFEARSIRRQVGGRAEFVAGATGRSVTGARRRGKFLWLVLDDRDALVAHLGMSGQILIRPADAEPDRHLRVVAGLSDGRQLRFCDQRTFGGLFVSRDGAKLPPEIAHIARDPLDPELDDDQVVTAVRRRRTGVKRALLDQRLISGIGNIYADEALWRARLHYARPTDTMRRSEVHRLLEAVRAVMAEALEAGGTSFDALYVDVNGNGGYFERALTVYGREGEPCPRCGTPIRRRPFMNRSSYTCPRCQPRPRRPHW
ncbi:MAG: bifunctional DNA-formamidopyrimidine glycosylase/DNA-(apurinic or apyrimidinic site) lyase [Propionibacteriales bacterium]|nr:bifunctional DNA-formamidopyrimidine glycosylase/DNA-(apurinic or apyrimidinic site) lyase [Propionibacteriales bacterium]